MTEKLGAKKTDFEKSKKRGSFIGSGMEIKEDPLRTRKKTTWCPSCPNHIILDSFKKAIYSLIEKGHKHENFTIVTGIGCHGKIFDYLNLSGVYALHGRTIPVAEGIKIGNPNLNVVVFAGDGDTYAEGIEHFVHACRFNPDITLIVFDNQSFSLTTGQATPTSQLGFKTKAEPSGVKNPPLNPISLALSAGASFVARCNAYDLEHTQGVIQKAIKHRGFSFIEVIQDCLVFNLEINARDKQMYKISDKERSFKETLRLSQEYDYSTRKGKIPIGIFYKNCRKSFDENYPLLVNLRKKKTNWKNFKRERR